MPHTDHAAEAQLAAILDTTGDIRAALVQLCAGLSVGDVEGETYQAALERMLRQRFGSQQVALHGIEAAAERS